MVRSTIDRALFNRVSPRLRRGFATSASYDPGKNPRQSRGLAGGSIVFTLRKRGAFTLIEMLVAMAITLVMMGAVVTLFANISNSVRNRRATTEMSGQLRHVRNVLQQDLQGATCPGVTWQRPESNHGYIEIIEGPYKEGYATNLIDADPPTVKNPEIDHKASTLPSSNLPFKDSSWATDAGGLGDGDDILMLTVRNEHEPFNGRSPTNVRLNATSAEDFSVDSPVAWGYESIQSTLAEVVWFAIENPGHTDDLSTDPDPTGKRFFGEPGMRTIYRRTLLIAPWLNPYRFTASNGTVTDTFTIRGSTFKAQPGMLRILPANTGPEQAIAAVVAFQDRYDLSVRLEWDGDIQRWKIMANTLGDLTKRENRFQHFGFRPVPTSGNIRPIGREFPFAFISSGSVYSGLTPNVQFATDPDPNLTPATAAIAKANVNGSVESYTVTSPGAGYKVRPFAFVNQESCAMATAQAMLNDDGEVVRVVLGPVPLWGTRRGEDVMMSDVLAFDLRVYDPGAPVFASRKVPNSTTNFDLDVVVTPSEPGWRGSPPLGAGGAYFDNTDHMQASGLGMVGNNNKTFQYVGQGAYVDMGYGYDKDFRVDFGNQPPPGGPEFPFPKFAPAFMSSIDPWFFRAHAISDVWGTQLAPGYAVYDTWSFHYENNGINEDGFWFNNGKWHWYNPVTATWQTDEPAQKWRKTVDQGVNGLDDNGLLGIDDVGERETTPPYDVPLRGMQALIRTYEHDSRAIRQVRVNQHFLQE